MPTGTHSGSVQILSIIDDAKGLIDIPTTGSQKLNLVKAMPAAIEGLLSTRTNDTEGVFTSVAHGFDGSETFALFWSGGYCYRCTVDSYDDDTVTFTAAAGDALPTAGTGPASALKIAVAQQIEDTSIDGSLLQQLMIVSINITENGLCEMFDSVPTSRLAEAFYDNSSYVWPQESGEAAPFSQTITDIYFYNGTLTAGVINVYAILT